MPEMFVNHQMSDVPDTISNLQARAIMARVFLKDGSGLSLRTAVDRDITNAFNATRELPDDNPDKQTATTAYDAWNNGGEVVRKGAMFRQLQAQYGFTDEEVAAIFQQAKSIIV